MSEPKDSGHKPSRYQIFFRTSRGGSGIEYETAKAEFLSVFWDQPIAVERDLYARMRMEIAVGGLTAEEISHRANMLGYTQGIIGVHEEPYLGEELRACRSGRWVVGWIRRGDMKLLLTEIYKQDEEKLLAEAPHRRVFLIELDGKIKAAKGHRYRRGMSPNDAKFMLNIAELRGDEVILDPFAGLGGIAMECRKRNLQVFGGDTDTVLRHGLAQISHNKFALADARHLPFNDHTFHAIITEPPFDTRYRQAVLDAMPELRRVVHPGGKIILLIAQDMHAEIMNSMFGTRFRLTGDFILRRHGKLISHVLAMHDK